MSEDDELEALRRRKLEQLQMQATQEEMAENQEIEFEAQKKMIMRQILTPDAMERLGTIRTARPKFAEAVEAQLLALLQAGRIGGKIDDETLKKLLAKLQPKRREIRIERR